MDESQTSNSIISNPYNPLVLVDTGSLEDLDIGLDHLLDEGREVDLALPAELGLRLGGVTVEELDLGGSVVPGVDADEGAAGLGADSDLVVLLALPPDGQLHPHQIW
jgi:hypothetical protein